MNIQKAAAPKALILFPEINNPKNGLNDFSGKNTEVDLEAKMGERWGWQGFGCVSSVDV